MTERTRVLLYLLFATLVVASCSDESSLLAPEPIQTPPVAQMAGPACPPLGNVCLEIKSIVKHACPADSSYTDDGARERCCKRAFRQAIKPYRRCFSKGEINSIRRCVFNVTPDGHVRETGDEFQSEPVPNQ
jgi:hypothetical protein